MNGFIQLYLEDEKRFKKSKMFRHLGVEQVALRKICECLEAGQIEKALEQKALIEEYGKWFKKERLERI